MARNCHYCKFNRIGFQPNRHNQKHNIWALAKNKCFGKYKICREDAMLKLCAPQSFQLCGREYQSPTDVL